MSFITNPQRIFKRLYPNQNAQATLGDINTALENYVQSFRQGVVKNTILVTWNTTGFIISGGGGVGVTSCKYTCVACTQKQLDNYTCNCKQTLPADDMTCSAISALIVPTGPGTFTVTLTTPPELGTADNVILNFGNASAPGTIITVDKVAPLVFNVSVYDAINAVFASQTLNNVPMFLEGYYPDLL